MIYHGCTCDHESAGGTEVITDIDATCTEHGRPEFRDEPDGEGDHEPQSWFQIVSEVVYTALPGDGLEWPEFHERELAARVVGAEVAGHGNRAFLRSRVKRKLLRCNTLHDVRTALGME